MEDLWSAGIQAGLPPERTPEQQDEHDLCIREASHFINQHCRVVDMRGTGIVPFTLFPFQEDLLNAYCTHRELIILKARQLGVTELTACYCLWATLKPYITVLVVSQDEGAAGEFVTRARTAWQNLPDWLREPLKDPRKTSTLEFANGSRILPFAATPRAGRSFTAQIAVLDEWAKQQHQEEIFAAVSPIIKSSGGQIIGISTAAGMGNTYHDQWVRASNGQGMHSVFLPWSSRPDRDQDWYDSATQNFPDWQRAQEFPTTADEAFVLSGRPRFDYTALSEVAKGTQTPIRDQVLGVGTDGRAAGHVRIWEEARPGHIYVVGSDVAEGLLKGDYSAAVVLDWATGLEVAELHGHWSPEVYAGYLAHICRMYNNALLGVERNNHGHAVLLALLKLEQYGNLYQHREYDNFTKQTTILPPGWNTTSKSKPIMISTLAQTIQERRPYRNALFIAEARTYSYTDSGATEASGNTHDDRIMAYSIAEMLRLSYTKQEYRVSGEFQTPAGYRADG